MLQAWITKSFRVGGKVGTRRGWVGIPRNSVILCQVVVIVRFDTAGNLAAARVVTFKLFGENEPWIQSRYKAKLRSVGAGLTLDEIRMG